MKKTTSKRIKKSIFIYLILVSVMILIISFIGVRNNINFLLDLRTYVIVLILSLILKIGISADYFKAL